MSDNSYGLANAGEAVEITAPDLAYQPPRPKDYAPKIGLIGCGGITSYHLDAYKALNQRVVAFCDTDQKKATERRDTYNPAGTIHTDYRDVLSQDDIEVVDVATHPETRIPILEAAIDAGKHILSQKPFVVDIETGKRLCDRADEKGVKIAVNQNGRWAPHFSYIMRAIEAGMIGEVGSIDCTMQWDHTWTRGTDFEQIHHLMLYDFGIHWFDIIVAMMGNRPPKSVYASVEHLGYQQMKPPFLASVVIDFNGAQARLNLNGHVIHGQEDRTIVAGSTGTLRAFGPELNNQQVALWSEAGHAKPQLDGCWFESGFEGTMGELLCAIEEDRKPFNNARDNLDSLALCFAAMRSANEGVVIHLENETSL